MKTRLYAWSIVVASAFAVNWVNDRPIKGSFDATYWAGFALFWHYWMNSGWDTFRAWLHRVTA